VVRNVGCVVCDQHGNLQPLPDCSSNSSSCLQSSGDKSGASIVAQLQQQQLEQQDRTGFLCSSKASSSSSSSSVVLDPTCSSGVVQQLPWAADAPAAAASVPQVCSIAAANEVAACAPASR
jgi:hypothetical protein